MSELKDLKLDGEIKLEESTFTRLVGGFNENTPILSDLQIGSLLEYKHGVKQVRETINRNIKSFEEGLHYLDLSKRSAENATLKESLLSLGYSKQSLTQAKNIYILSESGFLLYLKFAEGDKAVDIYKDFIEDYFKLRAKVESMEESIRNQINKLKESQAFLMGMSIMDSDPLKQREFLLEYNKVGEQVLELEKSLTEKETIKKLESKIHFGELLENSKNDYDIGTFAKFLNIEDMGRNKMFQWLKDNEILMKNNTPYQKYNRYFTVIPVVKGTYSSNKTLLKAKGIEFIVKKLIKDGKIITKSVEEILKELPKAN